MATSPAMGTTTPGLTEAACYYRAALACLQFVEARRPTKRRFGAEADARWRAFRGQLAANDRIDLLLRDANAEWPGAFGAREVFALKHVDEDEAFGASWAPLDAVRGEEVWRELVSTAPPASASEVLAAVAAAWGLSLRPTPRPAVDPTDRLVVSGPSAVAALAQTFLGRADLDWSVQVICVATRTSHRQLALSACAVVDTHKAGRVLSASDAAGVHAGARIVISEDALAEDRAALSGAA